MTRFHPVADNILLVADHTHLRLFDISAQKQVHSEERSCSTVSWSFDGSLACSGNREGQVSPGSGVEDYRVSSVYLEVDWLNVNRHIRLKLPG